MGWDDPRWQQLYPPQVDLPSPADWPTSEPDFAHEGGVGTPGEPVPHYLDLIAQEAATTPAPPIGYARGLNIADGPGGLI